MAADQDCRCDHDRVAEDRLARKDRDDLEMRGEARDDQE